MDNQVKLNLHEKQCITPICKRGKNTFLDLTVNSFHQWFLNVKQAPGSPGGACYDIECWAPFQFLSRYVWDRVQVSAFLTSSQVMLMLAAGLMTILQKPLVYTYYRCRRLYTIMFLCTWHKIYRKRAGFNCQTQISKLNIFMFLKWFSEV